MSENKNINPDKSEQALWDYISGSMDDKRKQETQAQHRDDPFWNDAVEGLNAIADRNKINKINADLHHQLKKATQRNNKKKKQAAAQQQNIIITLLILIIAIVCYLFFHFTKK